MWWLATHKASALGKGKLEEPWDSLASQPSPLSQSLAQVFHNTDERVKRLEE